MENFETHVGTFGVDIDSHISTTNIQNSVKDLVTHLKMKTKYKIYYEKLDPTMLEMLNGMTNDDVSHFHRDNFMIFKDFSAELKRNEMFADLEETKRSANLSGYSISGLSGRKKK